MRWLPAARSGQWWVYAGVSSLVVSILLWLIRFALLGQTFTGVHAFRFMLLAVILSFLIGFAGWLGARRLWLLSTLGMAAGLIMMASYARNRTGWEDLISLFAFLEAVVAGFAVGLVVEAVYWIVRSAKKK
ncbi:hypothetical protein [Paenibacillus arenilitoris]|uniref:Uncharacterized protein n=1 Tax=Paenibacillus arenilitoris TaxID=2772299 RepID=A0A927CTL4_9BACL|nr:hypothetical protein [Paenibacillus arenilitoris]MBD2871345.1 hypothetical protein [Paenibacillus arenilitoris]